jgi:hypothetical protein
MATPDTAFRYRYPVLVDAALHGDRVIRLSSTNGPGFELLTDAVSWAEVNWLSFVDDVPPLSAIRRFLKSSNRDSHSLSGVIYPPRFELIG